MLLIMNYYDADPGMYTELCQQCNSTQVGCHEAGHPGCKDSKEAEKWMFGVDRARSLLVPEKFSVNGNKKDRSLNSRGYYSASHHRDFNTVLYHMYQVEYGIHANRSPIYQGYYREGYKAEGLITEAPTLYLIRGTDKKAEC